MRPYWSKPASLAQESLALQRFCLSSMYVHCPQGSFLEECTWSIYTVCSKPRNHKLQIAKPDIGLKYYKKCTSKRWYQFKVFVLRWVISIGCRTGFWFQRQNTYLRTCALSEDSDQPAHSRSLIRIFTEHILDSQGCNISSYGQRRLRSDYADKQVYLSVRSAHMTKGTFSHIRLLC